MFYILENAKNNIPIGEKIVLTFNDTEEKAVEKAIAALADMIPLEAMQPP